MRRALLLLVLVLLAGCSQRYSAPGLGDQEDPALSGNGRLLVSVVDRGGRRSLRLVERSTGRELPLPGLRQGQPHRSPSLSWTGRYLAFIRQRGTRPEAVLLDRLSGRLQPLALPNDRLPERLSLAPDGQQLAAPKLPALQSMCQQNSKRQAEQTGANANMSKNCTACHSARINPNKGMPSILK